MKRDRMLELITRDDDGVPWNLAAALEASDLTVQPLISDTAEDLEVATELEAPPRVGEKPREAWCGKCGGPRDVNANGCIACAEASP